MDYGRKMQKLLMSHHSGDEEREERPELMSEIEVRNFGEIKSEYEIKMGEEEGAHDDSGDSD